MMRNVGVALAGLLLVLPSAFAAAPTGGEMKGQANVRSNRPVARGDYTGKYVGTFEPHDAARAPASATVAAEGEEDHYRIVLSSRPGGPRPSGSQWRRYNLVGEVEHGRFHMDRVSGQIVEPVTFSEGKLIATVQGTSGGTFDLHRVKP